MFDLSSYHKDCAQLTLGQEKIQEMITMTENKKKKAFRYPVRVMVLAAALVAALGLTAAATDGPVKDFLDEIFITFTFTAKDDVNFCMFEVNGDADFMTGLTLPTMAYAEKDGRKLLTLDGEELDVTEAMEKDGYYEQEIEGATLRVTADGMATVTVYNADGEVDMTYTVGLTEEGVATDSNFEASSYWEGVADENGNIITVDGEPSEAYEVKEAYKITEKDGEMVVTDGEGNIVDLPRK